MRSACLIVALFVAGAAVAGCGEVAIGQPCIFSWPRDQNGTDCQSYPTCAPLQDTSSGTTLNNNACPIDCIQLPSLQCTNLICVATQIEGNNTNINGECSADLAKESVDCPNAALGCKGYCTKECLSDASCPKGYHCSPMAPFGSTLQCDDESKWGTECTGSCTEAGATAPSGVTCPSSTGDADYSNCDNPDYAGCCACICYRYCPLLSKKFCRKASWDKGLFPNATTNASSCGTGG